MGPECVPFWSYTEWGECKCGSLFKTRSRTCKIYKNKNEVATLNDSKCSNLPYDHEPLSTECVEPKVSYGWGHILVEMKILGIGILCTREKF